MNYGNNQYTDNNQYTENNPPGYGSAPSPQPPRKTPKKKSNFGIGLFIGILSTLAVVLLITAVVAFFFLRSGRAGAASLGNEEKLSIIRNYLDNFYLGELNDEQLEDGLAEGLLEGTGDRYAKYYSKSDFQELLEDQSGSYCGIGVVVSETTDGFQVTQVFTGSPAEEAGVLQGDYIIEADGDRSFEDLDKLVSVVRGEEGSNIDLVLRRAGEEIPVSLQRRKIDVETVSSKMLEGGIGYLRLAEFDAISVSQFNEALESLEKEGATSLILDLRDNPGGDYDSVVAIADRVLPKGPIATVINNQGAEKVETSDEEHKITLPMVLLVNQNSASASEFFSAAVKDYGIATLVGQTTYGKGIVQSIFRLPDGSGMKFTTDEYLSPKGNKIDGVGVTPDIEIEIPKEAYEDGVVSFEEDTQLQKAIEILSDAA